MTAQPSPIASRLAQSGADCQPFRIRSLSVSEVTTFSATRIRALPGLDRGHLATLDLPLQTGTCRGDDPVTLCLGPNQWLVLSESGIEHGEALTDLPSDSGICQWDETDGLAMLQATGDAAPWLMRKSSGLDFQVSANTPHHCAQCKFGKIKVVVYYRQRQGKTGDFNLLTDRSLARYLWTLLISTAPHAVELQNSFGNITDRAQS